MRVLEAKPAIAMVNRKHKIRKQNANKSLASSDTSDDEGKAGGQGSCRHCRKAVNFSALRKSVKQLSKSTDCTSCSRDIKKDQALSDAVLEAERPEDGDAEDTTLWLCLQCAHLGCDRNSKHRHALKHYQAPRSNSHAIVLNINTGMIWCYDCDDELSAEHSRRLTECVDYVNKQMVLSTPSSGVRNGRLPSDVSQEKLSIEREEKGAKQQNKLNASTMAHLPNVKGLSNLGNTCFFNAVMQNLNRTPLLEPMLAELSQKGHCVDLSGRRLSESGSGSSDVDDTPAKVEVEPLQIVLTEGGPLTQSVLAFLNEMNASNRNSTVFPNRLFGQVCKKAPRFKGFQQQDSHELLRHLMDGMKAEEIKRSHAAILSAYQLPSSVNPKKVDDDTKLKIKEHGRQVKHTFVDQLFGGYFLSSVLCEECQMPSQMLEPFLDISLPVLEEKIPRPNMDWKHDGDSRFATEGVTPPTKGDLPATNSKHMTKKAKKQAKRDAKRKNQAKRRSVILPVEPSSGTGGCHENGLEAGLSNGEDGAEEEEEDGDNNSDADVEDNVDADLSRNHAFESNQLDDKAALTQQPTDNTSTIATASDVVSVAEQNELTSDCHMDGSLASCDSHVTEVVHCNGVECVSDVKHEPEGFVDDGRTIELQISDAMRAVSLSVDSGDICHLTGELATSVPSTQLESSVQGRVANDAVPVTVEIIAEDERPAEKLGVSNGASGEQATENVATSGDTVRTAVELTTEKTPRRLENGDDGSSGDTMRTAMELTTTKPNRMENGSGDVCDSGFGETDTCRHGDSSSDPAMISTVGHVDRRERWRHQRLRAMRPLASRPQLVASECSILSCLADFTTAELLTGANRFGCATCSQRKHGRQSRKGKQIVEYTNASKQFLIFRPPAILTLHLKRFQQVGYSLRKMNRHVDFPMLLDLAPYCSELAQGIQPGKKRVLYSLYGAVEHSGRLSGGHYTAYVKVRAHSPQIRDFLFRGGVDGLRLEKLWEALAAPETQSCMSAMTDDATEVKPPAGKWYYISDSRVNEVVSEANVLRCQAYLLFYERIY